MDKTARELFTEKMKAKDFINDYYKKHNALPYVDDVIEAKALDAEDAATVTFETDVTELVLASEDWSESAVIIGEPGPKVGYNVYESLFGEIIEIDDLANEDFCPFFKTAYNGNEVHLPMFYLADMLFTQFFGGENPEVLLNYFSGVTATDAPIQESQVREIGTELANILNKELRELIPNDPYIPNYSYAYSSLNLDGFNSYYSGQTIEPMDIIQLGMQMVGMVLPADFISKFKDAYWDYRNEGDTIDDWAIDNAEHHIVNYNGPYQQIIIAANSWNEDGNYGSSLYIALKISNNETHSLYFDTESGIPYTLVGA